ncbi:MAG: CcmD family protein [Methanomassiliicoccales archaeon]|nr:MAG: CcmD family protein [Methanomassiliicoccales archaeon]
MGELEALYLAYTIIWAGLFGYLAYLHMKQMKLSKDLKLLEEMVKKNERK